MDTLLVSRHARNMQNCSKGKRKHSRGVVFLSVGWGQKYRFLLATGWNVPEDCLSKSMSEILTIRRVWASRAIGQASCFKVGLKCGALVLPTPLHSGSDPFTRLPPTPKNP